MVDQKHIVVLTGAGMSAESGLKTFRDSDGLWMGYNIEDVATPRAFKKDPGLVLNFYNMRRREVAKAQPNAAHIGLAKLEEKYQVSIVTQNIDDLHERAGSTNVLHLHGEIFKMFPVGKPQQLVEIHGDMHLGQCDESGTQYRPFIVWFEEPVPMIEHAIDMVSLAEIFVIAGTSLQVYPAAGLINAVPSGTPKYIIDKSIPAISRQTDMHFIEKPATAGVQELLELLM